MDSVIKEGPLFKLPTWSKGPASQLEKQFKLRYFALRKEGEDSRIFYYESDKVFKSGGAPLGSLDLDGAGFERVNKLDFVLRHEKKRLWCRAFSERIADSWEDVLAQSGARAIQENLI